MSHSTRACTFPVVSRNNIICIHKSYATKPSKYISAEVVYSEMECVLSLFVDCFVLLLAMYSCAHRKGTPRMYDIYVSYSSKVYFTLIATGRYVIMG